MFPYRNDRLRIIIDVQDLINITKCLGIKLWNSLSEEEKIEAYNVCEEHEYSRVHIINELLVFKPVLINEWIENYYILDLKTKRPTKHSLDNTILPYNILKRMTENYERNPRNTQSSLHTRSS